MAKRKKQNKKSSKATSVALSESEDFLEPDPRTGNPILLRASIVIVAIWMIILICIAIWK